MSYDTHENDTEEQTDAMAEKYYASLNQPTDDEIREVICGYLNEVKYKYNSKRRSYWKIEDWNQFVLFIAYDWNDDQKHPTFTEYADPLKSRDAAHLCVDALMETPHPARYYLATWADSINGASLSILRLTAREISLGCYRVIKELERADV